MKKLIFILLAFATSAMAQQYRTTIPIKDTASANYLRLRAGQLVGNDTNTFVSTGGGQGYVPAYQVIHAAGTYTIAKGASVYLFNTVTAAANKDTVFLDSISHYTNPHAFVCVQNDSSVATDSIYIKPAGSDKINGSNSVVLGINATAYGRYYLVLDPRKLGWIKIP